MKTKRDIEIKKLKEIIFNQKKEIEKLSSACSIANNDLSSAIDEIYMQRDIIDDLRNKVFAKNKYPIYS